MKDFNKIKKIFIITLSLFTGTSFATSVTEVAHSGKWPTYPKVNYGSGSKAALIKKGEYLAKIGDCIACHTSPGDKPFAGGLPFKTPFGTLYSPNITPDKKTGIGKWDDKDFIKAMHEGVSKQGYYYYPAFPYLFFNKVSTEDLKAIKAYLDAIPAVEKQNRKNNMKWPFSIRFLQLGWRILFFEFNKGQFKPDPTKSKQWNRGKYIVEGLGHCSMCHTPSYYLFSKKYPLAAPNNKYYLAGNFVQGFYAPNITSAQFKKTPVDEITRVFLKDKLVGGGTVQGPMEDVNHDSLDYLTHQDLDDIGTYLKTVQSKTIPKPKSTGQASSAAGKAIYNQYCVSCHGSGAGGAPRFDNKADWDPRIKQGINTLYKNAINGIGGMPAKGLCSSCTNTDIQSAVLYMVDSVEGKPITGPAATTTSAGPSVAQMTSIEKGKQIYDRVCSICHNDGKLGAPKLGDHVQWNQLIKLNMDVLIRRALYGYKAHPIMGACNQCTNADIIAAVKYMVQESVSNGNYKLW